ncbi:hypothetical protein [Gilliamella sp. ESL0250]|uniref:hypothetical protein n=1 Tax=Gilliamella sp. ESL0250 TaxID=2705036 RepID=UPI001580FFBD|nr:hypothetical protein [Gilliamella sp. ESL0250]NUF49908.1 hypothetical protein [Gilliamella sp. ESL0250]
MIKESFIGIFPAGLFISFIIQTIAMKKNWPKVLLYTDIIFSFIMGWVYAIYVREEENILTIIKLVFYVMCFGCFFSAFYWLEARRFPWSKQSKTSENETKKPPY